MLMSLHAADYVAWGIALGVVVVFIILLCWHNYTEYKEREARHE